MSGLVPMAEYRRVIRRCERLEEQVAYLKSLRKEDASNDDLIAVRLVLGLSGQLAEFLLALMRASPRALGVDALNDAIPTVYAADRRDDHLFKVIASRTRTRLREEGHPVRIQTVWGVGYQMDTASAAWIRTQIAKQKQEIAA